MRAFLIVIDGFGIGALPDADAYGDAGSDTYGNTFAATGVQLPALVSLGLNNIDGVAKAFPNGRALRPVSAPRAVGRVIARPFVHEGGRFTRTADRRDYALEPPGETLLDKLQARGIPVTGVGKIADIFCGRGIARSIHTSGNAEGLRVLTQLAREEGEGLVFANLVDTDMLYGHRNDAPGYAEALRRIDAALPAIEAGLRGEDLLLITADHGCDPTTPSTDHSREYVPLLVCGGVCPANLGTLDGLDSVARLLEGYFGIGEQVFGCIRPIRRN